MNGGAGEIWFRITNSYREGSELVAEFLSGCHLERFGRRGTRADHYLHLVIASREPCGHFEICYRTRPAVHSRSENVSIFEPNGSFASLRLEARAEQANG
jgi:hypothetical protein